MKPESVGDRLRYGWHDDAATSAHDYLLPAVLEEFERAYGAASVRVLDLGCGNGYVAGQLASRGHTVVGVDVSEDGIVLARSAYPQVRFEVCSLYSPVLPDLVEEPVDCIVSLEVIEHLFYPKRLIEQSFALLRESGLLIVSTPYHGYLKNLALSIVGAWDRHHGVSWDGGHIKFFSRESLAAMFGRAGFRTLRFRGVGRLPWLWKSMIMIGTK